MNMLGGTAGQIVSSAAATFDPYAQGVLSPPAQSSVSAISSRPFYVTRCVNGYLVSNVDKQYIARDIDEILEAVKLILVSDAIAQSA